MEDIKIRKLTQIDDKNLNKMTEWMYEWWGKSEAYTFEEIKNFMKHSMQEVRLPQTYGAFIGDSIVGMYQFSYEDLFVRPDIYPWLANVYVDAQYRNQGICKKMMESVTENAIKNTKFDELWLYTKHINLYEKFNWKYIDNIDTCMKEDRIQRLYKLDLIK